MCHPAQHVRWSTTKAPIRPTVVLRLFLVRLIVITIEVQLHSILSFSKFIKKQFIEKEVLQREISWLKLKFSVATEQLNFEN